MISESTAEVRGLELVAKTPDAVDICSAARVDPVAQDAGQPLVVGGKSQLWIAEAIQVRAQEGGAEFSVVDRIVEVDAPVQQSGPGPGRGVRLDLHQPDGGGVRPRGPGPPAPPARDGQDEVGVETMIAGGPDQDGASLAGRRARRGRHLTRREPRRGARGGALGGIRW